MANFLEYILSLKDQMSGNLNKIGITSEKALDRFAKLEKEAREVDKTMKAFGGSIGALRQKLNLLRSERDWIPARQKDAIRSYSREIEKLERQIGRMEGARKKSGLFGGMGGGLKGMLGGALVAGGIAGVAMGAVSGVGKSMSLGMEAGKNKTSFEVLAGKEGGNKLYGDLIKFAQDSIFGNEVYENAQMMKAFGIETEKVMPSLKMLGDISMGNKDKLGSLSLAYSQIMSTGRLMGQDLLQLINAGFNPLKIISEQTGLSLGDLKDKMDKGAISAEMVEQAFKIATSEGGQFYNMTNKIAETPFGKFQAMQGQIEGIAMQLGLALMPVATNMMNALQPVLDMLPTVITMLQPVFDVIAQLPLANLLQALVSILSPVLNVVVPILQIILALFNQILGSVMKLVSSIMSRLGPLIEKLGGTIGKILAPVLKLVGWLLEKIIELIDFALTPLYALIDGIGWIAEKIGVVFEKVMNFIGVKSKAGGEQAADNFAENYTVGIANSGIGTAALGAINNDETNSAFANAGSFQAKLYAANFNAMMSGAFKPTDIYKLKTPSLMDFSIKKPTLPGITPPSSLVNTSFGGGSSGGKAKSGGKSSESVATGGQKNVTVNISYGNAVGTFNLTTATLKESVESIKDLIIDTVTRGVAQGASLGAI